MSIPFFPPTIMASSVVPIGTPTSLGSAVGSSTGTSSLTITTGAAIAAGNLSVVFIGSYTAGGGHTVSSVSDGTNTYTRAGSSFQNSVGGFDVTDFWYKENCAAVSSSATITVTMSTAVQYHGIAAATVSGILTSSSLDAAPTGSGANTASPTLSTGVLAQANEVVFGCLFAPGPVTITEDAAFTRLSTGASTGGANRDFDFAYKIVAATTSQAYSPTLSGASPASVRVYSFKGN